MKKNRPFKGMGLAGLGGLSVLAAWMFVDHPYYGLMLMDPLVLIIFYVAFYGGGLAVLIGLAMAVRAIARS